MGCRVFRVGVFFDGTGNNKFIDAKEGDGSASNVAKLYELYNEHQGEVDTIQSKPLYTARVYKEGIGTKTRMSKGGRGGTAKRVKDRRFMDYKSEKGAGGDGAKRINEAIKEVFDLLDRHQPGSDSDAYCERIIDVFGFSRGAAQARDFINTFHDRNKRIFKLKKVKMGFVGIYDTVGSFGIAGNNNNMKPANPDTHSESDIGVAKFVKDYFSGSDEMGLSDHLNETAVMETQEFGPYRSLEQADTIAKQKQASLSATGADWRTKVAPSPFGGMHAPPMYVVKCERHEPSFIPYNFHLATGSAKKIVHMTADSEVRKNFPLSSLLSVGVHEEYAFLGVHSDIGGGYADTELEPHSYMLKTFLGNSNWLGDLLHDAKKDVDQYVAAEKVKLQKSGDAAKGWKIKVEKETYITRGKPDKYTVLVEKDRALGNDLAKITLNLMHEKALLADVPLKPLPQNKAHSIPDDLQDYFEYCKDDRNVKKSFYLEHKGFADFSSAKSSPYFQALNEKYRHHSAVDPAEAHSHYDGHTGIINTLKNDSPDGSGGNDVRYVGRDPQGKEVVINARKNKGFKGELVAKREIYPNVSKKAIVPKVA